MLFNSIRRLTMPLIKSKSKKAVGKNIKAEMAAVSHHLG
jgi:hypothetical protein